MRVAWGTLLVVALGACGRLRFDDAAATGGDGGGDGPRDDGAVTVTKFRQLDAAGESTCGVFRDRAYCWGANEAGQLGVGDLGDRAVPTEVQLPAGTVTQVDVGTTHACALVDGAAWCWGSADLGDGVTTASAVPIQVAGLPAPITQISAGYAFTCAIAAGDVYCWGNDGSDKLGNGPAGSTPLPVRVLTGPARHVFPGGDHACAVRADGSGWCWGHNDGPGALGIGTSVSNVDAPVQVVDRSAFTAVTTAGYHACGIDAGAAWCWGTGDSGELGDGAASSSTRPVAVVGLGQGVEAIHTGGGPVSPDATCAIKGQAMWCWGSGLWGRLGNRVAENLTMPAEVAGLGGPVRAIAVGWYHSCASVDDGEVACWGRGDRGELGDGARTTGYEPVRVVLPAGSD